MASVLRSVYHITAFSWYTFIVKSLAEKGGEELPPGIFVYGGPWKYLTFLNLVSTLYKLYGTYILDIIKKNKIQKCCLYSSYCKCHSLDWLQ